MNSNLIYVVSLAVLFNCVISVAKHSGEDNEKLGKKSTDLLSENNISQFSEGNSVAIPSKSRIVPRKGVNSTEIIAKISTNVTLEDATNNKNISSDVHPVPPPSTTSSVVSPQSISNVTVPSTTTTTLKPHPSQSTTTKASTSTLRTLATKKVVKKPTITYSADDNSQILDSEKNIKYINVTSIEDSTLGPKTASDTDRTIVEEEQRTRRNYILYMGLAFALPMAFTLIHLSYKKIKNWMEIRHYERVDFLVDGMYIS